MSKATAFAAFLLGAAVGSAATWYALKTKYEQFAEEEINDVREYYSSKLVKKDEDEHSEDTDEPQDDPVETKSNRLEMTQITERQNYSGYFKAESEPLPVDPNILEPRPYVISPEEFGEIEEYNQIDITIYADDVIADDDDDILEDPENVIGLESLKHFGEYAEHTVYVRNDRLKCDYEISRDGRTYEEVLESKPYKRMASL